MSKFEQLLDYLINEEMDKANELFHEIVVEKSRDIYENLISEEDDEEMDEAADEEMDEAADEEMDESADEEEMDESADEEMDESADEEMDEAEDEEMDESDEELEDSYMMDTDDADADMDDMPPQDKTDDFGGDVEAGGEEEAIMDIKAAIDQLEAAFAELEMAKGGDMSADSDFAPDSDGKADEMMGIPAMENRRLTREYKEKVGNDWDKNSMKSQGQIVGANTGEKMPTAQEGRPPISSGKGKPTTGASAHNILGKSSTHAEDGTKPHGKVGGLVKQGGKFVGSGTHNVDGVESGVKTVKKQGSGYPGNNKSAGPVGSGTGDKAGQTSGAESAKSPLNGAPNRNA